ncbi:DUF1266 domain-containing protein [Arachidicoccus sp.]|uniref:DUF1266 domain-containing protein n=1 Tax=Arachidicoccus sp. TaxID=1872624 RepID=UPI003D24F639
MKQKKIFQRTIVSVAIIATVLTMITGCKNQSSKTDTTNNQTSLKDDTLKGFLLAGVYFVQGYGGSKTFMDKIKTDINKSTAQKNFLTLLDTAYHHYFVYPYPHSVAEKVDARNTLSSWFQVNNQSDFYLFLTSLKDSGFQAHFLVCKKALDENGGTKADISKIDLDKYNLPKGSEVLLKFVKDNYNKFSPAGIKAWNIGLYVYTVCLGYGAEYIDGQNGKSVIVQMLMEAQKDYPDWKTYYSDFMLGRQFAGTDPSANATYQKTIDDMLQGNYSAYKYLPLRQ